MDLKLSGRRALVCGASGGLGFACAASLAREGVAVTLVARGAEALAEAAQRIAADTGASVHTVSADVTTQAGREAVLQACGNPDILVTNAGGPPTGDFLSFADEDWQQALNNNLVAPVALIRAVVEGMAARSFGRIVNITSGALKAPGEALVLSHGARLGLIGAVASLSRRYTAQNVTINHLLPGPFLTARLRSAAQATGERQGRDADAVLAERLSSVPAGRFGDPAEFGDLCAYLCSAQAGFITGQSLLIDGGSYRGLF